MGILDLFRRAEPQEATAQPIEASAAPEVRAFGQGRLFSDLTDPDLVDFLRGGHVTESGATVSVEAALRNPATFRSVTLLSFSVGMLPVHLYRPDRTKAEDHPLFRLLHRKPNGWQTAFEFRSLLQAWALVHGDGVALKVKRGTDVLALLPLDPSRIEIRQDDSLQMEYRYRRRDGTLRVFGPDDVFHVRGFSLDGVRGRSLVRQAAEAIGLALQTERAAARLFRNGMMVGGALKMPAGARLSPDAIERLRASLDENYAGAQNAHRWMILEEGLEPAPFAPNAKDSQHVETRRMQIEEVARVFGVPRPLLMMDETSWGSGIDVLGQFFVRYGLNPWFVAWEQAIERDLLSEREQGVLYAKFNAGALLRGSMKDQAEFFAKALGSGGHQSWMHPDEVRDWSELPARDDLPPPPGAVAQGGRENDQTGNA